MDDYLGPVPNVHGVGYDLFFNERIVSGFDAMFYTKAQAKRHCAAMRERYPRIKVDCRFAGEVLQPSEPKASPRPQIRVEVRNLSIRSLRARFGLTARWN
jgi:hypothetical protein